ncbi:MAG: hypothetical protein ACR2QJ_04150 [Geminicoccaceae bacterium]
MASNRSTDIGSAREGGKRALQQMLPAGWRFAHQTALDLISQIEHLAWRDRADALDVYFTQQADGMLGADRVSNMVGGRLSVVGDANSPARPDDQAAGFATWCRAVTTAVMIDLDQNQEVEEPTQALTYLVARDWQFAKSAAAWVAENGMAPVAEALKTLPGYAIVLLATSPNDTVERFVARDAFWQAIETKT